MDNPLEGYYINEDNDYVDLVYALRDDTRLQYQSRIPKFVVMLMSTGILKYVTVDGGPYKILSLAFDGDNSFGTPRVFVIVESLGEEEE